MVSIRCLEEYLREPALMIVDGRVLDAERVYLRDPVDGPIGSLSEICEIKEMTVTVSATMKDGQVYSSRIFVCGGAGGANSAIRYKVDPKLWIERMGPIGHVVAAVGRRILRHLDTEAGCLVY